MAISRSEIQDKTERRGMWYFHITFHCYQSVFFFFFFFYWLHGMAWGIFFSLPGIKPIPPAMEAWILNYWTTREVPISLLKDSLYKERGKRKYIKIPKQ